MNFQSPIKNATAGVPQRFYILRPSILVLWFRHLSSRRNYLSFFPLVAQWTQNLAAWNMRTCVFRGCPVKFTWMLSLSIIDFAINTEHVFSRAVPFEQMEFTSFSEAMLTAFGLGLLAKDISLDRGDGLYNYRLTFGMFNGSSDIVLTSAGLTVAFRNGRNKKALQFIGNSLTTIETSIQKSPVQFRRLTFAAHAEFHKSEEFEAHMGKIADKSRGYSAGGVTLHTSINPFKGELRFTTDKSLVYPQALFVSCEVLTEEAFFQRTLNQDFDKVWRSGKGRWT